MTLHRSIERRHEVADQLTTFWGASIIVHKFSTLSYVSLNNQWNYYREKIEM